MTDAFALSNAGARGIASGSQVSSRYRAPITFTSRLRGLKRYSDEAAKFFKTTKYQPTIYMAVNPNSIEWTQPKRFNKRDVRDGSVFFHFTNSKGQNNDVLTLRFSGSTGNINLAGSLGAYDSAQDAENRKKGISQTPAGAQGPGNIDTGAFYKFIVWHNLYQLTREPHVLTDGTENVWTIQYQSPLFPAQLRLEGFFNAVLQFTEEAGRPNSRAYSFEFTVTSTDPDLDEVLADISGYTDYFPTESSEPQIVDGTKAESLDFVAAPTFLA
jgi:hypothetical protein